MKSTLILLAVILTLGVLLAAAQTNTFCAANLACTVTGAWNHTGGLQNNGLNVVDVSSAQAVSGKTLSTSTLTSDTFDISLNTLKSSSNTAGHYARNNGTQYVDNTIQGGDLPTTNVVLDAEASGNTITIPAKIWIPAAGCNNATPSSFWDLPTATPAAAACVTGANTQKGVLDFADTAGGFSAQTTELLPADFSGNIDARIIWLTTATTGNAKWSLSTICTNVSASATDDPTFNAAISVITAAPGSANQLQTSSISAVTITGCTAGQILHIKLFRDGNDAADTITATARFYGLELTIRRAM
jgi:hypothetical protein